MSRPICITEGCANLAQTLGFRNGVLRFAKDCTGCARARRSPDLDVGVLGLNGLLAWVDEAQARCVKAGSDDTAAFDIKTALRRLDLIERQMAADEAKHAGSLKRAA